MKQRLLLTAILFVACSISVAAQESRWSLKPNGGITVATLSGDEVEYLENGWGWTLGVEAERWETKGGLYFDDYEERYIDGERKSFIYLEKVRLAVLEDFQHIGDMHTGQLVNRIIIVDGIKLQYTVFRLFDGSYNVGRIHEKM